MRKTFALLIVLVASLASAQSPIVSRDGELGLRAQTANTLLCGPATGTTSIPTFRSLVAADLPDSATALQMLQSGGTSANPAWSTATWPATTTVNQLLYSSATNTVTGLATANSAVLVTSAAGVPSFASAFPAAFKLIIPNGATPAATCTVGEIFIDTDETDDTNCTTTADNSLCICVATNTWVALENN